MYFPLVSNSHTNRSCKGQEENYFYPQSSQTIIWNSTIDYIHVVEGKRVSEVCQASVVTEPHRSMTHSIVLVVRDLSWCPDVQRGTWTTLGIFFEQITKRCFPRDLFLLSYEVQQREYICFIKKKIVGNQYHKFV